MQGTTQTPTQPKTKACCWNRLFSGTGFVESVEMSSRIKMLLKLEQIQLTFFFFLLKTSGCCRISPFYAQFLLTKRQGRLCKQSTISSQIASWLHWETWLWFCFAHKLDSCSVWSCAVLWNSLFDVASAVDTGDCICTRLRISPGYFESL